MSSLPGKVSSHTWINIAAAMLWLRKYTKRIGKTDGENENSSFLSSVAFQPAIIFLDALLSWAKITW